MYDPKTGYKYSGSLCVCFSYRCCFLQTVGWQRRSQQVIRWVPGTLSRNGVKKVVSATLLIQHLFPIRGPFCSICGRTGWRQGWSGGDRKLLSPHLRLHRGAKRVIPGATACAGVIVVLFSTRLVSVDLPSLGAKKESVVEFRSFWNTPSRSAGQAADTLTCPGQVYVHCC